jgi:hypothetical protein
MFNHPLHHFQGAAAAAVHQNRHTRLRTKQTTHLKPKQSEASNALPHLRDSSRVGIKFLNQHLRKCQLATTARIHQHCGAILQATP